MRGGEGESKGRENRGRAEEGGRGRGGADAEKRGIEKVQGETSGAYKKVS